MKATDIQTYDVNGNTIDFNLHDCPLAITNSILLVRHNNIIIKACRAGNKSLGLYTGDVLCDEFNNIYIVVLFKNILVLYNLQTNQILYKIESTWRDQYTKVLTLQFSRFVISCDIIHAQSIIFKLHQILFSNPSKLIISNYDKLINTSDCYLRGCTKW